MPTRQPTPDPFREYRKVQAKFDDRTRAVLEAAARDIQRRILRLRPGVGGKVRASQLRLVLREIELILHRVWGVQIMDILREGREEAMMTAENAAEALEAIVHGALPDDVAQTLSDGLRLAATAGIKRDAARIPRELSSRVYKNQALSTGAVTAMIRRGLVEGLSARELAQDVKQFISPSTPGGVSYAAMRLARTEINNAFHEQQIAGANRPGVTGVQWNLSGSHVVPDECNIYAETDQHGMGVGVFPVGKVPDRPHPQCFCYLTYVTMSADEFAKAMEGGAFDDEIDRRTKANLERLSQQKHPSGSSFEDRVAGANRGEKALAASHWGVGRRPRPREFSRSMEKSIETYTSRWFTEINAAHRGLPLQDERDRDRVNELMDEMGEVFAGSKVTEDVVTYRGVKNASVMFGDAFNNDLAGVEWVEEAPMSTTAIRERTRTFLARSDPGNLLMRVLVPAGTPAIEASPITAEAELLLKPKLKYRVVKDYGVDDEGTRVVDVEVIHGNQ